LLQHLFLIPRHRCYDHSDGDIVEAIDAIDAMTGVTRRTFGDPSDDELPTLTDRRGGEGRTDGVMTDDTTVKHDP